MPDNIDLSPLTILVTENRWDAVDLTTPRNIVLTKMLTDMGGVNHTLPQGTYHFNAIETNGQLLVTLYLAPK